MPRRATWIGALGALGALALVGCEFNPSLPGATGDGGPPGIASRRQITINPLDVGNATDDVVVPVILEGDGDFAENAAGDGSDIVFVRGGTRLAHDIENLNVSSGELIAWVRLPSLGEGSGGDSFELFYGAGNRPSPGTNAWQGLADLVFHFEEGPELLDHSPTMARVSQSDGARTVSGVVGSAFEVEQSALTLMDSRVADRELESFSLGFWFFHNATVGAVEIAFAKGGQGNGPGYWFDVGGGGGVPWQAGLSDTMGFTDTVLFGSGAELDFRPVYLMLTVDREKGELRAYADGSLTSSASSDMLGPLSNPEAATISAFNNPVSGWFDELRAYPRAMPPEWVALDYALTVDRSMTTVGPPSEAPYPTL